MMNPGPIEEAGQTARSTIDALKSSPLVLSLVIFNILFITSTAYISVKNGERWERVVEQAFKSCPQMK